MVDFNTPDPNNPEKTLSYHIDARMLKFLDRSVKAKINLKDKDYVMIIDGYEGSGKSTLAMQVGKYVDPTLDLSRVCMTADEFKVAILNATRGQCVIYDEAVTGMTAADSISRVGKLLKSLMMQMRQNNLFVIVILPTIFDLNRYAVLSRSRSFFHVYERKGTMGYWVGYNRKDTKLLYIKGKKTYTYRVLSRFKGRFYGKYVVNEEEYRQKKKEALSLIEHKEEKGKPEWLEQRDWAVIKLREFGMTYDQIEDESKRLGSFISHAEVGRIVADYKAKHGKIVQKPKPI